MNEPRAITRHSEHLSPDQLRELYREMVRFRRFEEAAARAYGMGKIHGFCHLHIGQEAIAAAVGAVHQPNDIVIGGYRTHTMALSLGMENQSAMDELFGKATGCVQGLGGSMHLFAPDKGFYGGWGLVGQQVPTAAGFAFGQQYRENGGATMVFIGDGAVHQGAIHETLNLASIWDLPLVTVIENNHYGMGTAVDRVSSLPPLHELGAPYKIEHWAFDGMDVLASYDALFEAMKIARETSRPVFLEATCSRFRGHSMGDPGKYRTREQLEAERGRDPIPRFGNDLVDRGVLTKDDLKTIDDEQKAIMKTVLENAENAPLPDLDLIDRYVYADQGGQRHE